MEEKKKIEEEVVEEEEEVVEEEQQGQYNIGGIAYRLYCTCYFVRFNRRC